MNNNEEAVATVAALIGAGIGLVIGLAIAAVICWVITSALKRVPAEHRRMEPGQVWLLMIPCFSIIWNFFVFARVSESFQSYFNSVGRTDMGDCGKQLGLWYSISAVGCLIPFVNIVAGLVALILMILTLVKFHQMKDMIPA